MANAPKNPKKKTAVYKQGKLTKNNRFATNSINWTIVIVCCSIIASFVFAILLGSFLGDKAHSSQSTTTPAGDSSTLIPPKSDKVSPQKELHAYFADMTNADPNISLSEQTATARESGNALFFDLRNADGSLVYSSSVATELGFSQNSNLKLDRLANHLDYYIDYAVALFESYFASTLDAEERMAIQNAEALLLKEATEKAFPQIIIEFSHDITRDNAIYYQSYLLNLKLACPTASVGIKLPYVFVSDSNNSGVIAAFMGIADFYVLDLGSRGEAEIASSVASLVYFNERYEGVIMLDSSDAESLAKRIDALLTNGVKNYVIK